MIKYELSKLMMPSIEEVLVPSEHVASVYEDHSLITVLMILTNRKYQTIPVLNKNNQLLGLINMTVIANEILNSPSGHIDALNEIYIRDIELINPVVIYEDSPFEFILSQLVNENFISLVDEDFHFLGIITRRKLLSRLNHLMHSNMITDNQEFIKQQQYAQSLLNEFEDI